MDVPPIHPRAADASPRLRRTVAVVLILAGAGLATATVLARPAPVTPVSSIRVDGPLTHLDALTSRLASAGDDTGPGCAESEVAKHPVDRP